MLTAEGRWNQPGIYGALYLAQTELGARAEWQRYADLAALNGLPFGPHELVSLDITVHDSALDLTDPATLKRFGVTLANLRSSPPAGFTLCRKISDLARLNGTRILLVPSAPLAGATNIIIHSDALPTSVTLRDGPDRKPLR